MMKRICLSCETYDQVVRSEYFNKGFDPKFRELEEWLQQCKDYYDIEFIGLNYFLSKNIEKYTKRKIDCMPLIRFVYSLGERFFFTIEEFDHEFIQHLMLRQSPSLENSLDDDLIAAIENHI